MNKDFGKSSPIVPVTHTSLVKILSYCLEANVPLMVWGRKGIGKSDIVKSFARMQVHNENLKKYLLGEADYVRIFLGQADSVGDIIGLPRHENGYTVYDPPRWFPKENTDKMLILHLDEFTRIRKEFRNAALGLVEDRIIYSNKLPDNVRIIASANPPSMEYFDAEDLDEALIDRFVHVLLTPSKSVWEEFAKSVNIPDVITKFASTNPELIVGSSEVFPDIKIEPNGRTLHKRLWPILRVIESRRENGIISEDEFKEDLAIMSQVVLGPVYGLQFYSFYNKAEKPITFEEFINEDFDELKEKIKIMTIMGRVDLQKKSIDNAIKVLGELAVRHFDKEDEIVAKLLEFSSLFTGTELFKYYNSQLTKLPKETRAKIFTYLKRNPKMAKVYVQSAAKNSRIGNAVRNDMKN